MIGAVVFGLVAAVIVHAVLTDLRVGELRRDVDRLSEIVADMALKQGAFREES